MIDPERPDYADTPASEHRAPFDYAPADAQAEPLVSIVTPFFNTGAVFHETARSVLRGSLQAWEWLIVNDASTSGESLSVLAHYRHGDDRIRVIDLPRNSGPSAARNAGYARARAPFVLQLDSDNLIEPTAAEKWWWYLETHPGAGFVKGFTVGFGAQTYLWRQGFHSRDAFLTSNPVDATSLVRVSTHRRAGGYDESLREGLEDWDFWLRCAAAGEWGGTVPEFLDWYRRRPSHNDRWSEWDGAARQRAFVTRLRERYPAVFAEGVPAIDAPERTPNAPLHLQPPQVNRLRKGRRRLLMIVPWFAMGGSDKFNLDLIDGLRQAGWDVTLAATSDDPAWLAHFARLTPDVFALPAFLAPADYPQFLRYLIASRTPDVVCVSHSELGYHLLPFLRAHAPEAAFVDYCHIVEDEWLSGGYPRLSLQYRALLDLSLVSSRHLKDWMVADGADPDRVQVCYTGGSVPDAERRREMRERTRGELGLVAHDRLVLYPARLCAQKQPRVFAETMRSLRDAGAPFSCIVAGTGPERSWLGAWLKKHRLTERVRLLDAVPPSRMSELMAAADICFLPSTHEGVALTLYEAMSHGTAFVGADVGGQREVAPSSCAVLLPRQHDPAREAAAYATVLAQLLRSPEATADLGETARRRIAQDFSTGHMIAAVQSSFADAMSWLRDRPRVPIPLALAALTAERAMEYDRASRLAESLWRSASGLPAAPTGAGWRMWLFRQATHLEPLYVWGVKRGWRWLPVARERIRAALAS